MTRTAPIQWFTVILALLLPQLANAFDVNINSRNPRAVYLRVGDGLMANGPYSASNFATPGVGGNVPIIRATVPTQVGQGLVTGPVLMTTPNNPRTISDWDNFQFCNSGQVYVGGFYRSTTTNGTTGQAARLTYTAPATLNGPGGVTIPISQISWTTSGNGDIGAQPISAGTFAPGQGPLTTFTRNRWRETCMTFSYANQALYAGGTYTATVTFTLAQP
ncbi:hypothetical protein [Arenimonas alkanexedens]